MNESIYELYKLTKRLIERTEKCCEKDHSGEELFKEWKKAITFFDAADKGYGERYEKEKNNEQAI